jgi:hypothetical protein
MLSCQKKEVDIGAYTVELTHIYIDNNEMTKVEDQSEEVKIISFSQDSIEVSIESLLLWQIVYHLEKNGRHIKGRLPVSVYGFCGHVTIDAYQSYFNGNKIKGTFEVESYCTQGMGAPNLIYHKLMGDILIKPVK